ncbi:MAG: gliding motility lipoprotein GldH [Clostridium sp.]|nr:gliding motility lipoprotein GldH [Clostridium sp.]
MTRRRIRIAAAQVCLLLLAILTGCGDSGESTDFRHVNTEGWLYGDTLRFGPMIPEDTSANPQALPPRELRVAVRHTNDYPYRNLWLEVCYRTDDGRHCRDTVGIELCDLYGRWYGKGLGMFYQVEQPLGLVALRPGSIVSVTHVMRVDTLRGVERVGVEYILPDGQREN